MEIEYDPTKQLRNLQERGLDFDDVPRIFEGATLTYPDERLDYGEARNTTIGFLDGRMVILVWTQRGAKCRVISLRKANEREQKTYGGRMG
jgi:uncharacterized protein